VGFARKSREVEKLAEQLDAWSREALDQSLADAFAHLSRCPDSVAVRIKNKHAVLTVLPVRQLDTSTILRNKKGN
jgi:hypothetical protein